jgi:signal transduction histidine kinase
MRANLKIKFILFFVVFVLAPLFLMGVISLNITKKIQIQAIADLEKFFLTQKERELSRFIEEVKTVFEVRSGSDDASSLSIVDQKFLSQSILAHPTVFEVALLDLTGQETFKTRRSDGGQEIVSELRNQSHSKIFQSARKGDVFVGPLVYRGSEAFMPIARPLRNRSGLIVMVIAGEVDLRNVRNLFEGSLLGNEGYILLIDKGRNIFAASSKSFIGKIYHQSAWLSAIFEGEDAVGLRKKDVFLGLQNRPVFASGIVSKGSGLAIVVEWPQDDALRSLRSLGNQMVGFFFFLAFFVVVAGIISVRRVLRPLAVLQKGVGIIGGGNLDYKIQVQTKDELQDLANAFNRMGSDLKEAQEKKEQVIEAKALEEAFKLEKELSKNKSDFITHISHQLRTPISIMDWALESALTSGDAEKRAAHFDAARNGLEQLRAIINDLLVISEFGIGYKIAKGNEFDLPALLENVVKDGDDAVINKKINVKKDIAKNLPSYRGSKLGIQKVLENLLDNAITYTKENGEVIIRAWFQEDVFHLMFRDTGIGIPKSDQQSIFSAFFRAGNAVEQKNVGTGLGLLIVKNIVEGHGGKIWFESEQGKGSTFFIDLPQSGKSKG